MGVRSVPRGRGLTPGRDLPVPQRVEEAGPRTSQGSRLPPSNDFTSRNLLGLPSGV